jgi:hypothetical protein
MSGETSARDLFRQLADRTLATASTLVDELVASETFSRALAGGMQRVVGVSSAARRRLNSVGSFASEWLNVPTRHQVIELSRRLNQLEIAVDDVDAKAAEMLDLMEKRDLDD